MLTHSISPRRRTFLAGGVASVLAALAIAAPAGATVPDSPDRMNVPDNVLPAVQDNVLPAGQEISFHFTRPGG